VHAYKTIKGFEINIKDNGPGIPKNFQKQIFEKFFRVPKGNQHDIKGFGIGLYYAKNILNKHGFTLFLTPDEKWTTFNISVTK
jgi:two-component system phosphate regulon sensor histidine kinase PhoR